MCLCHRLVCGLPVLCPGITTYFCASVIRGSAEAGATGKFAEVGSVLNLTAPACALPAGLGLKGEGEGEKETEGEREK